MREEKILLRARFDEKLPRYWLLSTLFVLAISCIGIPVIPFWFFFGWKFHRKQYERLECELTERSLNIRRGVLFRVEKNIPLDKIQDVAMKEGPILRYLGLSALSVETAGQSSPQGVGDAALAGVVDAPAFRDAVLNQRDAVVSGHGAATQAAAPLVSGVDGSVDVLREIRDSLQRVEQLLERQQRDSS